MQTRLQIPNPFTFIWKNRDTLILAFLLAAAVWASAVLANDPNRDDLIEGNVPLQIIGLDEDLIFLKPITGEVVVRMRAPESVWETLAANPDLVSAVIDFSGLRAGEYTLPVEVTLNLSPAELLEIQPSKLTVSLDQLVEETRAVEIQTVGIPAAGFEVEIEGLLFTPEEVEVSGPASQVEQVTKVLGKVSVNQARQDLIILSTLLAVDEDDRQISNVTVTPNQANVTVNISQIGGYRDVAVKVETTGQPANGYRVNSVAVEPPTVTLFSEDEELITEIQGFVSTLPIDLADRTSDFEVSIGLNLQAGLIRVGDVQTVLVRIGVAPIETSVLLTVPIQVVDLSAGLKAVFSPATVDVFLSGPEPVIQNLTPDDVVVFVSLAGLAPGSYLVEADSGVLLDRVRIDSINPDTIEVIITIDDGSPDPTPTVTPSVTPTP